MTIRSWPNTRLPLALDPSYPSANGLLAATYLEAAQRPDPEWWREVGAETREEVFAVFEPLYGAGKSTLIKCISGVYHAEGGEIYFEGRRIRFSRPIDARQEGIETIYQDLALANNLDVGANIFLGREVKKRYLCGLVRVLDEEHMRHESEKALNLLEIRFPNLTQPIESLSGGQRQAVAIARAVYWDAKLLIMDEPTNGLGVPEQRKVLELIRKLRDQGVPIILISHTLPDAVADRLIVLHRGRKVTEKQAAETDAQEIVQYMVGALDDTGAQ